MISEFPAFIVDEGASKLRILHLHPLGDRGSFGTDIIVALCLEQEQQ